MVMFNDSFSIDECKSLREEREAKDITPLPEAPSDAGLKARSILAAKKAAGAAKRLLIRIILLSLVLAIVTVSAAAYYVYDTRKHGYAVDRRDCSVKFGTGELTGTRTYGYTYDQYLDRFVDKGDVDEKTYLNLNGNQVTVFYVIDGEGKLQPPTAVDDGDRGRQPLKTADAYIFISGKTMAYVRSDQFCK